MRSNSTCRLDEEQSNHVPARWLQARHWRKRPNTISEHGNSCSPAWHPPSYSRCGQCVLFTVSVVSTVMAVTTVVVVLSLLPFLLLAVARLSILVLGRYLISQSQDRRDILRALFKRDLDLGSHENVTEVDNGWEKLETPPAGSEQDKWSGIVGFFHPFW